MGKGIEGKDDKEDEWREDERRGKSEMEGRWARRKSKKVIVNSS